MTPIELRQLQHFLAVADHRTMGKAAVALNLTQPALSKSIKRLEYSLKASLFERSAEGMMPTIYGKALVDRARHLLIEAQHTIEEISALRGALSGTVTVGAGPSLAATILPAATARLMAQRPNVQVVVLQALFDPIAAPLLRGDIDFVLGTFVDAEQLDALQAEFLFHDEVSVVVRCGHPLAKRRNVSLRTLAEYSWVLTEQQEILQRHLRSKFLQAGIALPPSRIRTNSVEFMLASVTNSDMLTYVPRSLIALQESAGRLTVVHAPEATWIRDNAIIRPRHGTLSPAAKALIAELRRVPTPLAGNSRKPG
jgi:LysR family transcriptional regulator of gallate degradation